MKTIPLDELLETAVKATKIAGHHALAHYARRRDTAQIFTHDLKLVLDLECQQAAEAVLRKTYPTHGLVGEEDLEQTNPEGYEWIIDPIDGTMNFTQGFPYWCVSIAVRYQGIIQAGAVYAPELDRLFTAHLESEALLNGTPIRVSETKILNEAFIFSGINKKVQTPADASFQGFQQLVFNTRKVRITGSAALDICHVACGQGDGFSESGIYLWDHAAAGIILERAGGRIHLTPRPEEPYGAQVICSNATLYEELLELCLPYF